MPIFYRYSIVKIPTKTTLFNNKVTCLFVSHMFGKDIVSMINIKNTSFNNKRTVSGGFSDSKFSDTYFPTPNFLTTTFSDGQVFRQTHFPKSLCILSTLIKV